MKKGKEVKVKLNKNFKTYYGTIDNKELKTIYAGITTWITPNDDLDRYSLQIALLRKIIKNCVNQNLNSQLFKFDHHIVDIDVKESRMGFNKASYLNIEITLFVKNGGSILSNIMKLDLIRFLNVIVNTIEKLDKFKYSISKKHNVCSI